MNPFGITFKARWPGVWYIEDWKEWLWTPELEFRFAELPEWKLRPAITEAYVWPDGKYHETVRPFGEHMWNARLSLQPDPFLPDYAEAFKLAHDAFKFIYTQGLGWLDMPGRQEDNKLYRPDIWSMITSGAKRSVLFKMRKLKKHGFPVCWVEVDTIGVITDSESIEPLRPLVLDREGLKGGYRYTGSVPITLELIELFEAKSKHPKSNHSAAKKAIDALLNARKECLV